MKRAMRDILLLVVLLVQTSCIDNLLDYPATTKISADTFWETTEDAEKGVNAVYNAMRNAFGLFYRLDCYPNADLVYFQNANSQSITSDYWNKCYVSVNRANNAIMQLRRMQGEAVTDKELNLLRRYEGEVRFIRALHYALMIDLYGDIQYLDHVPTQEEAYSIARTPIVQVKDLIFEDYDYAISVLPVSYESSEDQGRATKIAAYAFKGKLELFWASWKKNGRPEVDNFQQSESEAKEYYEKAIGNFKEVMKPAYNLQLFKDGAPGEYVNPNYLQLFTLENEKCSEVIFSLQYGGPNIGQGEEFVKIFGNRSVLNGWANMQPTNYLVNLYQSTKTGDYVDPIILSKNQNLANGSANPKTYEGRDYRMRSTIVWNGQKMRTITPDGMTIGDSLAFMFGNKNGYLDYNDSRTGYMFRKFVRQYAGYSRSNGPQDFYLMRLPDVWLMYCEAMNELHGPSDELYNLVDKIRGRGKLPALDRNKFKTKDTFFDAIKQERAIEFVAEGQRFFDLRRWRLAETVWDYPNGRELRSTLNDFIQDQYKNATDRTFPRYYIYNIPEDERVLNPNLTQNKPWL